MQWIRAYSKPDIPLITSAPLDIVNLPLIMSSTHCLHYKEMQTNSPEEKEHAKWLEKIRQASKDTEHYLWYRGILHMIVEMFIISYAEDTVS